MKSRTLLFATALAAVTLLAVPALLAAQKKNTHQHHHYQLIDMGTFGGPMSFVGLSFNSFPDLNDGGVTVGSSATSVPTSPTSDFSAAPIKPMMLHQPGRAFGFGRHAMDRPPSPQAEAGKPSAVVLPDDQLGPESFSFPKCAVNTQAGTYTGVCVSSYPKCAKWWVGYSCPAGVKAGGRQHTACGWIDPNRRAAGSYKRAFEANGLNNHSQVVGGMNVAGDQSFHPFLCDGRSIRDLGTLGGNFGNADWLTEAGAVVGWSTTPGDLAAHAFLWRHGTLKRVRAVDDSSKSRFCRKHRVGRCDLQN